MLCMIQFLDKDDFGINMSSWSMPQLENFFIIWYVMCSYIPNVTHTVSIGFSAI